VRPTSIPLTLCSGQGLRGEPTGSKEGAAFHSGAGSGKEPQLWTPSPGEVSLHSRASAAWFYLQGYLAPGDRWTVGRKVRLRKASAFPRTTAETQALLTIPCSCWEELQDSSGVHPLQPAESSLLTGRVVPVQFAQSGIFQSTDLPLTHLSP
jgi:hypothetical protein